MTSMLADPRSGPAPGGQPTVLLVDSEAHFASLLAHALRSAGYHVEYLLERDQIAQQLARVTPDVVILDAGARDVELTRELRMLSGAPIVIVSDQSSIQARVAGLDAGADDYLPKPFAVAELLARLRALQRGRALATARERQGVLAFGDVRLELDSRELTRGDRPIELRNKGFELLAYFLRNPERVLSRRELFEKVWGYEFLGDSNVIEVTVSHLRHALEAGGEPRLIHTVRPIGYILSTRSGT